MCRKFSTTGIDLRPSFRKAWEILAQIFFLLAKISERRDSLGSCLFEGVIHDQSRKQLFEMSNVNNPDASLAEKVLDLA